MVIAVNRAKRRLAEGRLALGFGATLYPSTKRAPVETVIHRAGHVYPPNASKWIVTFFNVHAPQP